MRILAIAAILAIVPGTLSAEEEPPLPPLPKPDSDVTQAEGGQENVAIIGGAQTPDMPHNEVPQSNFCTVIISKGKLQTVVVGEGVLHVFPTTKKYTREVVRFGYDTMILKGEIVNCTKGHWEYSTKCDLDVAVGGFASQLSGGHVTAKGYGSLTLQIDGAMTAAVYSDLCGTTDEGLKSWNDTDIESGRKMIDEGSGAIWFFIDPDELPAIPVQVNEESDIWSSRRITLSKAGSNFLAPKPLKISVFYESRAFIDLKQDATSGCAAARVNHPWAGAERQTWDVVLTSWDDTGPVSKLIRKHGSYK